MVTQTVTASTTLDSATELALIPIAELTEQITVSLAEGIEGQTVWLKAIGNAGDMNVDVGVSGTDTLEADTGLETMNSAGASRLMYFTAGVWIFLTYM